MLKGRAIPEIIDFGPSIGPVGLEICYDIRWDFSPARSCHASRLIASMYSFPELHTILVRKGAKTLLMPSAFTLKTGKDHWCTYGPSHPLMTLLNDILRVSVRHTLRDDLAPHRWEPG